MSSRGVQSKNEFSELIVEKWKEDKKRDCRPIKRSKSTVDDDVRGSGSKCSSPIERLNNQLNDFIDGQPEKNVNIHRELSGKSAYEENNGCHSKSRRESGQDVDGKRTTIVRRSRKRVIIKGLCWAGWILCCPCWACGLCLREDSWEEEEEGERELERELRDDPCWPCFYRTSIDDPDDASMAVDDDGRSGDVAVCRTWS